MSNQTQNTNLEVLKKDVSAQVLTKIEQFKASGELKLPKDYSPENALKSAYLILLETKNKDGQNALDFCTKESIANSLLKMVTMGLSVMKKQGNFIMYGNKLAFEQEYAGNIVLAKRFGNLKNIKANAIFEGDTFAFEVDATTGRKKIVKHEQTLDSIGSKNLKGAYAVFELNDGSIDVEIMNIQQIKDAWNQGSMKGQSPAHRNFPDQMACKTVINRACKLLIRSSDDSILYADEEEKTIDVEAENVKHEIEINANKKPLDFDNIQEAEVIGEEVVSAPQKQEEPKQPQPQQPSADLFQAPPAAKPSF